MEKIYDLIIIGGGPAGVAAGVYAARKHINTALITESFGGQSIESNEIQNWIGNVAISGTDLAKNMKDHVKFYASEFVDLKEGERVTEITHPNPRPQRLALQGGRASLTTREGLEKDKNDSFLTPPLNIRGGQGGDMFLVKTNKGEYQAKTILIATGSTRRKLDVPGAKEFEGKGITYCASCDGPFFENKDVVVVGGGNAGFETAAQLLAYCKSVTLISNYGFNADPVTVKKVLENPKMTALENTVPYEIKGDKMVESLIYRKTAPFVGNSEIKTEGIFVEIGHVPATGFARGVVEMDDYGHIKVDPRNQRSSKEGIWAAGDCTDGLYNQNNIAAGDAVKALEDIYIELQRMK